ncbi:hypothetical protein C8F04DRAFT_1259469 [Mycena alexandri]|uniref:Uncharacterized protein n=1 Tax=Mycena alexandri TaxID=1745969 RepID=A0AAD6X0X3_9AGAR|nr:hypothetical protein C8F04DRAFT_1259469 [Mycena alexandri]
MRPGLAFNPAAQRAGADTPLPTHTVQESAHSRRAPPPHRHHDHALLRPPPRRAGSRAHDTHRHPQSPPMILLHPSCAPADAHLADLCPSRRAPHRGMTSPARTAQPPPATPPTARVRAHDATAPILARLLRALSRHTTYTAPMPTRAHPPHRIMATRSRSRARHAPPQDAHRGDPRPTLGRVPTTTTTHAALRSLRMPHTASISRGSRAHCRRTPASLPVSAHDHNHHPAIAPRPLRHTPRFPPDFSSICAHSGHTAPAAPHPHPRHTRRKC